MASILPVYSAGTDGSWVYFGSFAKGAGAGVFVSALSPEGSLTAPRLATAADSPSFLEVDAKRSRLVLIAETKGPDGSTRGAVETHAIDPATGMLTRINSQVTNGGGFCHVAFDRTFKWVFAARYNEGNAVVLPVRPDGSVGPVTCTVQHEGKGPNASRQERAHAHSVQADPNNRFVWVADLGTDEVRSYRFDAAVGQLAPHQPASFVSQPGSGPRHFAFTPDARRAYVLCELNSTVVATSYDAAAGTMTSFQTVPLLPSEGVTGDQRAAEVVVHPSGKFLYATNRGLDALVVFAIDGKDGRLTFVERHQEDLAHPRNFAIDPSGRWLLCANRDSNTVLVYQVDQHTGRLRRTGRDVTVPEPVCVRFIPRSVAGASPGGRLETHKSIWLR